MGILLLALWLVVLALRRVCDVVLEFTLFWISTSFVNRWQDMSRIGKMKIEDIDSSRSDGCLAKLEKEWWREYLRNPSLWWDNRSSKRSLKSPNFKLKAGGKSLWVDGWYTP